MSGWTPGPWFVAANEEFFEIRTGERQYQGGLVADVCSSRYWFDGGKHRAGGIAEANANLIAAAPDLYAALDRLCRALVHDHNKNIDYWTEALAALAKARGES